MDYRGGKVEVFITFVRKFTVLTNRLVIVLPNTPYFDLKTNLPFLGFLKAPNPFSSNLISSAAAAALKLYFPKRSMCSKDAGEIWSKSSSLIS